MRRLFCEFCNAPLCGDPYRWKDHVFCSLVCALHVVMDKPLRRKNNA